MMGRSWWKLLGFNSPCKCAYTIQRQEEIKKLKKLKEQNEELKEYQKDIDSVEQNLIEILNQGGETYEELTFEMLPDIVKELKKALDFHILEISKMAEEKTNLEEQIDELGDYCKNLSDEPYTQDAYEVFEKITQ